MEKQSESLEFFFIILPKESKEDFKRLCNKLKIGDGKAEILYNWINVNKESIKKDISYFTKTKIPGIGSKTINNIKNYNRDCVNLNEVIVNPRDQICLAISKHNLLNRPFKLKELYKAVSDIYGGSDINIFTGQCYLNKNKEPLTYVNAKLRQEGSIRSFIEEHSQDSRQHWVKAGVIYNKSPFENLFSNQSLRIRNELSNWQMERYVDENIIETFPSRSGLWEFKPGIGQPTEEQFNQMKLKNDPVGMHRQLNRSYGKFLLSAKFITTRI